MDTKFLRTNNDWFDQKIYLDLKCVVVVVVFVIVVDVNVVVVDTRNLPLKFGKNWVRNSWDIADIEFVVVVV